MKNVVTFFFTFYFFTNFCQVSIEDNIESNSSFSAAIKTFSEISHLSGFKYFDYHSGIKKQFLFNGNFAFPFLLSSNKWILGKRKSFFQNFQFSPDIKIRLFQNDSDFADKSKPVRTPSYIPKLSYFFTHQKFWNKIRKSNYYLGISAIHHSNGQDGWEFDYNDSVVNIYNGSFSESLFFNFMLGGKILLKSKNINPKDIHYNLNTSAKINNLFWKVGFDWHPIYFSNQKLHESKLYGGNRFTFNLLFQNLRSKDLNFDNEKEFIRFVFNAEYISDLSFYSGNLKQKNKIKVFDVSKRLNLNLSAYKRLFDLDNLAFFVQIGYFGSDNYNIYFQQSIFIARTGLSLGFFN